MWICSYTCPVLKRHKWTTMCFVFKQDINWFILKINKVTKIRCVIPSLIHLLRFLLGLNARFNLNYSNRTLNSVYHQIYDFSSFHFAYISLFSVRYYASPASKVLECCICFILTDVVLNQVWITINIAHNFSFLSKIFLIVVLFKRQQQRKRQVKSWSYETKNSSGHKTAW